MNRDDRPGCSCSAAADPCELCKTAIECDRCGKLFVSLDPKVAPGALCLRCTEDGPQR